MRAMARGGCRPRSTSIRIPTEACTCRPGLDVQTSERSGYEPSIEAVVDTAPLFDVDENEAWIDARQMAGTIAARWRPLCQTMGMNRDECDRYAPAFRNAELVASAAGNRPRG